MSRPDAHAPSDPAAKRDASTASANGGRGSASDAAAPNPSSFKITLGESIAARRLAEQSGEKKPGEPTKVPSAVSELLKSAAEVMKASEPKAPGSSASVKAADASKVDAKSGDAKAGEDAGVTIRVTGAKAVRTDSSGRKFEASPGKWDPRGANKPADATADGEEDASSASADGGSESASGKPPRKGSKGLNSPSPVVMAAGRDDDEEDEELAAPRTWETRAGVAVLVVLMAAFGGIVGWRFFMNGPKMLAGGPPAGETAKNPLASIGKSSDESKEKSKPTMLSSTRKDSLFAPRDPNVKAAAYEAETAPPADEAPPTVPKTVPGAPPSTLPSERAAERMPEGSSDAKLPFDVAGGPPSAPAEVGPTPGGSSMRIKSGSAAGAGSAFGAKEGADAASPPTSPGGAYASPFGANDHDPSTGPAAGSTRSPSNRTERAATGSSRAASDKPFMGTLAEMPVGASRRAAPRSPRSAPGGDAKYPADAKNAGKAEWPTTRDSAAAWPYPSTRDAAAGAAAPKTASAWPAATEGAAPAAWPPAGPKDAAAPTTRAAEGPAGYPATYPGAAGATGAGSAFAATPRAPTEGAASGLPGTTRAPKDGSADAASAGFPATGRSPKDESAAPAAAFPATARNPKEATAAAGTSRAAEETLPASPRATGGAWSDPVARPTTGPAAASARAEEEAPAAAGSGFAATPRAPGDAGPAGTAAFPATSRSPSEATPRAAGGPWSDPVASPTTGPAAGASPRAVETAAPATSREPGAASGTAAFPYKGPAATEAAPTSRAASPRSPWGAADAHETAPLATTAPSTHAPNEKAMPAERAAKESSPTTRTPSERIPSAPAEAIAGSPRAVPNAFAPAATDPAPAASVSPSGRAAGSPRAAETAATPRAPMGTPVAVEPVPPTAPAAGAPADRFPSERSSSSPLATSPSGESHGASPLRGGFRDVGGEPSPEPRTASTANGFAPAAANPAASVGKAPGLVEVEVEELVPARAADAGKYVVQPGDNYWTISQALYGEGGYHRALAAHLASQQGRGLLRVGDSFPAPSVGDLRSRYPNLCQPEPAAVAAAAETSRTYKVRGGETLHEIARSQLGKSSRWVDIYDLNQERLDAAGGTLPAGLELTLPADGPETASGKGRKVR